MDSFEPERIANLIACAAMCSQFRSDLDGADFEHNIVGETYESAFNEACRPGSEMGSFLAAFANF